MLFLKKSRRDVERINDPSLQIRPQKSHEACDLAVSPQAGWTAKQHALHRVLTELQPPTVLDIGSDAGWYAKLAALLGSRVVYWDTDPKCVTRLYHDACTMRLRILPLIMDFTKPTPCRGLASHWAIAATNRFQCDVILALGLLHRLVCERLTRLRTDCRGPGIAIKAMGYCRVHFPRRRRNETFMVISNCMVHTE